MKQQITVTLSREDWCAVAFACEAYAKQEEDYITAMDLSPGIKPYREGAQKTAATYWRLFRTIGEQLNADAKNNLP